MEAAINGSAHVKGTENCLSQNEGLLCPSSETPVLVPFGKKLLSVITVRRREEGVSQVR